MSSSAHDYASLGQIGANTSFVSSSAPGIG